jgi:hypothetical protein
LLEIWTIGALFGKAPTHENPQMQKAVIRWDHRPMTPQWNWEDKSMSKEIIKYILLIGVVTFLTGTAQAYPLKAALNSMQVVPFNSSTAKGNCRIEYSRDTYATFELECEYSGLSGPLTGADVRTAVAGSNAEQSSCYIKEVWVTLPNTGTGRTYIQCDIDAGDGPPWYPSANRNLYVVLQTAMFQGGEIRGQIKPMAMDLDVDGEGRSELSVFRPSDGIAYSYCSMLNTTIQKQLTWKAETDTTPFLADLDGDGIADWSFVRTDPRNGNMTIVYAGSRSGSPTFTRWGNANLGDLIVFGDYDGNGKIGAAVYRASLGVWYILPDVQGSDYWTALWGQPGTDRPCAGDYDGDGITDLCVVRPENGQLHWDIRRSSDWQPQALVWGLMSDEIFPASPVDVDADGINDVLVSRLVNGQRYFYALQSSDSAWFVLAWGLESDQVKIGDFNGDGRSDFAAIREVGKRLVWYINQGPSGSRTAEWGEPGDK